MPLRDLSVKMQMFLYKTPFYRCASTLHFSIVISFLKATFQGKFHSSNADEPFLEE